MMLRDPPRTFLLAGDAAPAKSGAESSVARLRRIVDVHYDALWRTLRYLGVPDAGVDDAAQQALCILARRLDDIEVGSERAFLFATAVRVASEARRAARRNRAEPCEGIDAFAAPGEGPEELVDQRRAQEMLRRIVDAMPAELRVVFVLFEIEELSLSEIADVLGIPAGTAASRLRRSRESFRSFVKRRQASERTGSPRRRP
jgi:RNA polymerase sigma-70 factor (ECF subfamily)